ncbi:MAG: hypothetical protein AAF383_18245 [Cyanobacteria bacterium P01_A01_bin.83]
MANELQDSIFTNSDTRFILLVVGLPIAGSIYCGLGIAGMAYFSAIREHPIVSGSLFFLIPFTIAASIWIRASARAYKN